MFFTFKMFIYFSYTLERPNDSAEVVDRMAEDARVKDVTTPDETLLSAALVKMKLLLQVLTIRRIIVAMAKAVPRTSMARVTTFTLPTPIP